MNLLALSLWWLCFSCFEVGLVLFWEEDCKKYWKWLSIREQRSQLQQVINHLEELEDLLMSGCVPDSGCWDRTLQLPAPWGELIEGSLQVLRAQGGALLPTLRRMRELAQDQYATLNFAQSRSAQSLLQAFVCGGMIPVLGMVLYVILPALQTNLTLWWLVCGLGCFMSMLAAFWIISMTEKARWGGLSRETRSWILDSQSIGERFLAWVRAGIPPDLAWSKSVGVFQSHSQNAHLQNLHKSLAQHWGFSVWRAEAQTDSLKGIAEQMVLGLGLTLKKSIQSSLMDGKPCLERVENALMSFRLDWRTRIETEVQLLGTRTLKPLFILLAPSLLGLIAFALWLSWLDLAKN